MYRPCQRATSATRFSCTQSATESHPFICNQGKGHMGSWQRQHIQQTPSRMAPSQPLVATWLLLETMWSLRLMAKAQSPRATNRMALGCRVAAVCVPRVGAAPLSEVVVVVVVVVLLLLLLLLHTMVTSSMLLTLMRQHWGQYLGKSHLAWWPVAGEAGAGAGVGANRLVLGLNMQILAKRRESNDCVLQGDQEVGPSVEV